MSIELRRLPSTNVNSHSSTSSQRAEEWTRQEEDETEQEQEELSALLPTIPKEEEEASDGTPPLLSDGTFDKGPSAHDKATLRRVAGAIPYSAFLIAVVEFAERFSYYGSTVVFTNFIQQPPGVEGQPGALGLGQRASSAFGSLNVLWVYTMPLVGAVVADNWLGRFRTICYAMPLAIAGHILLTISALPSTLEDTSRALFLFTMAVLVLGVGTGSFKSNISPLIAEQAPTKVLTLQRLPSGERVIVDPTLTTSKIYLYFYLTINLGALLGQISMTYAERISFWLAFLLPTIVFLLCPFILWIGRHRYITTPPEGSVLLQFLRLFRYALDGRWHSPKVLLSENFWNRVKPSRIPVARRPKFMTFDDAWVDEVRRGLNCCAVFFWYPLYWMAYNQLSNNLTSQAAVLDCGSLPNDLISNLDPIAIIILIPICDQYIYPSLARARIRFTPIRRIALGFVFASLSMICAAIVQGEVYKRSACGTAASTCPEMPFVDLTVFVQAPSIIFLAISEVLASVTGLEYAYSKAPASMRSLVMSIYMVQGALSGALSFIFLPLSQDPYLQINYLTMSAIAMLAAVGFWYSFRKLDAEEDEMNELPVGDLVGSRL